MDSTIFSPPTLPPPGLKKKKYWSIHSMFFSKTSENFLMDYNNLFETLECDNQQASTAHNKSSANLCLLVCLGLAPKVYTLARFVCKRIVCSPCHLPRSIDVLVLKGSTKWLVCSVYKRDNASHWLCSTQWQERSFFIVTVTVTVRTIICKGHK